MNESTTEVRYLVQRKNKGEKDYQFFASAPKMDEELARHVADKHNKTGRGDTFRAVRVTTTVEVLEP